MYLTMNRFKVKPGEEERFESIWRDRDSRLTEVPGFVSFHLMKGDRRDGWRLYASHTLWQSEAAFREWTRSDAFRSAHRDAGAHSDVYLAAPELETFESVQHIGA